MNVSTIDQSIPWSAAIDRLKFQKRVCTTFIPKETDKECCVCNYDHPKSNVFQSNETWNLNEHTKVEPTKCYGFLPQSNSPYLRCDMKTDLEQLCSVLLGVWNIPVPGLIMKMIGDPDSTPDMKVEKELLQGISNAAIASNAWIITNGYKEDSISELIGEVIYTCRIKNPDLNFNAIAVGKWGNIHDCHKFQERSSDIQTMYKGHGRYKLETNHTHYIFFDDGTCDSLDTGEFVSNLARQISCQSRRRIPLVIVLVGGTLHSLPSICNDLKKGVPVVIVNGCGPFGDLLSKYYKLTENSQKVNQKSTDDDEELSDTEEVVDIAVIDEIVSPDDEKTLRQVLRALGKNRADFIGDVRKLYNIIREQEYEAQGRKLPLGGLLSLDEEKTLGNYLHQMASCFEASFRKNIHVFNINSSKSLKETIYNAFVQSRDNLLLTKKKYDKTVDEEVRLALRWGIGDMTENQSVATAKIWNDATKTKQNRLFLIDALSKNLVAFVANFVKLDVDFTILFGSNDSSSARTSTRWSHKRHYLQELYSDEMRQNSDPLYLLDHISSRVNFTEEGHLAKILNKLVGDFMHPFYADPSGTKKMSLIHKKHIYTEKTDVEYIYRDLFLWCVLTYRLDMAKIFLSQMKTRICSALIASKILKSFTIYAPDQNAKDILHLKAKEFESHAIEFVRCAYVNDKHIACQLIIRRVDLYGGVTCLQMAFVADNKRFLDEDACQALLTNIWYDKVDPVREQNQLAINILTLGISQFFISIYQKSSHGYSKIKQKNQMTTSIYSKRELQKHGIDYTDDYDEKASIFQHFFHFHNRPIVKYCYSCVGYVVFLVFFSYYMLFSFNPLSATTGMHWTEILTIITVTTMLFEEFRQIKSQENRSLKGKIRAYFNLKNRIANLCLVLPAYLFFYIGLVLRFIRNDPESFASARVIMAIDLELWFIRSIMFIGIAPQLGPKIVMIRKMTNDLLLFIVVIVIFIFGYGITSRSMTSYGTNDLNSRNFFRNVIYPVYYFVHGSFDNERSQLEGMPENSLIIVTQLIFALHMLFVNILLLNLLIALFSFTINDIQTQAHNVWAYDRCEIIRTYHNRPPLCPPFTFIISVIQWCCRYYRKFYRNRCSKENFHNDLTPCFKMIPINKNVDHKWSEFERYSTNGYIRQILDDRAVANANVMASDAMSASSPANSDEWKRIKYLMSDLQDELQEAQSESKEELETIKETVNDVQSRLSQMETSFDRWSNEMKQIKDSLNWMMKTMKDAKMSDSQPPLFEEETRRCTSSQKQPNSATSDTRIELGHRSSNESVATQAVRINEITP